MNMIAVPTRLRPTPQAKVDQGMELPPAVIVGVEEEGFREEEQDVRQERGREHAHQVARELRIQNDEHERQACAERRGEREGHGEQLRELVREPVVSHVSCLVADRLDDDREDRDGEDERREEQVQLRDRPDRHAAADDGEPPVLGLHVGLRSSLLSPRPPPRRPRPRRAGVWSTVAAGARYGSWYSLLSTTETILTAAANIRRPRTGPRSTSSLRFFMAFIAAPHLCPWRWPAACAGGLARGRRSPTGPPEGSPSGTRASAPTRS